MKRLFMILAALTAGMSFAYPAAAQNTVPTGAEIKAAIAECDSAWTGGQNLQLSTQCKTACLRETAAILNERAGETEAARMLYEQARVSRQILEAFGPDAARHCSRPSGAGGTAAARPGQPESGGGAARGEALTQEQRIRVQRSLAAQGYDAGPADGAFGPRTRTAIRAWQRANGREATGYLTRDEAEALAGAGGASGKERAAALSPKCAGMQEGASCWIELANKPGCYIFVARYNPLTWSGACSNGVAVGRGTIGWEWSGVSGESTGTLVRGKRHGEWVDSFRDYTVSEGPYVNGKRHGRWVERYLRYMGGIRSGTVAEGPYVDGKRTGRWVRRLPNSPCLATDYSGGKIIGRSMC